jgi:hypothetical protein
MEIPQLSPQHKSVVPAELRGLKPSGSYTFDELYRLAQVCHASGLYADVRDAAQAMMKIFRGQELGIPPTAAMAAFDIIQKQIYLKPWAMAALINACGYGSYRVIEQTEQRCIIQFSRRYHEGWVQLTPTTYTIEEAQAHGLVSRSPHWKASPAHMLYLRAMGRGALEHFPELYAGLQCSTEAPPVSTAQAQQHIDDLWGQATPAAPTTDAAPRAPQEALPRKEKGLTTPPQALTLAKPPLPSKSAQDALQSTNVSQASQRTPGPAATHPAGSQTGKPAEKSPQTKHAPHKETDMSVERPRLMNAVMDALASHGVSTYPAQSTWFKERFNKLTLPELSDAELAEAHALLTGQEDLAL